MSHHSALELGRQLGALEVYDRETDFGRGEGSVSEKVAFTLKLERGIELVK